MDYQTFEHFQNAIDLIELTTEWYNIYFADFVIGKETLDFTIYNNACS